MQRLRAKRSPRPFWPVALAAAVAVAAMALAKLTTAAGLWWDVAWTAAAIGALIGTRQLAWNLFGIVGSPASPKRGRFRLVGVCRPGDPEHRPNAHPVAGGLADIAGWVRAHHERIDGRGYPNGIAGEEIPIEARILAVADAYEAIVADRPYRAGMPPAAAREELIRCAGTQFDPAVVGAFLDSLESSEDEVAAEAVARAA